MHFFHTLDLQGPEFFFLFYLKNITFYLILTTGKRKISTEILKRLGGRERERDRETDRQRDRQTDRQRDRERERERERELKSNDHILMNFWNWKFFFKF